jgi:hypothetical protein
MQLSAMVAFWHIPFLTKRTIATKLHASVVRSPIQPMYHPKQ